MNALLDWLFGRGDWMETFSGVKYHPTSPRVQDVQIVDIAHHLSMLCRYTGACREFYSVAEHSVHVSYCVPREMALAGLLHDGEESYVTDQGRPLKRSPFMWGYRLIARRNWLVIAEKFGLPANLPHEIHYADNAVLLTERAALMCPTGREWNINVRPADITIHCWPPKLAEKMFLDRFYELTNGRTAAVMPARAQQIDRYFASQRLGALA